MFVGNLVLMAFLLWSTSVFPLVRIQNKSSLRVSQGFWGRREHGLFQVGYRGTTDLGITRTKRCEREDKKNEIIDVKGTYVTTLPLHLCHKWFSLNLFARISGGR